MRQSTQPRTLLEIAIVRICNLENLDQLSALIAQLQDGGGLDVCDPDRQLPAVRRSDSAAKTGRRRHGAARHVGPGREKKKPETVS